MQHKLFFLRKKVIEEVTQFVWFFFNRIWKNIRKCSKNSIGISIVTHSISQYQVRKLLTHTTMTMVICIYSLCWALSQILPSIEMTKAYFVLVISYWPSLKMYTRYRKNTNSILFLPKINQWKWNALLYFCIYGTYEICANCQMFWIMANKVHK